MFARVSTYQGSPDELEDDIRDTTENIVPAVEQIPGSLGLYVLVNRESGRSMSITLWESEAALRESEQAADRIRDASAERHQETIVSVERFEVAVAPSAAAV
jgi:heme-degrading monooxygenase HmoA